jgi:hypothetical protein
MKLGGPYTLIAAFMMVVLTSASACGAGTQAETGFGEATDQVANDAPSTAVSSSSPVVRRAVLPAATVAAVSDYIAAQKSLLEEYATMTPDLEVGAVITFSHGVDQATLDQVVSVAGLKLTSIEWQAPGGVSGVSSVLVDPDLAAIEEHIGSAQVPVRGPVLAVAANGLGKLKDLFRATSHPDVLLVDPGPVDDVQADASKGIATVSQAPRSFYWRYLEAAAKE